MRPKSTDQTGSGDLFRSRLDQIINMKHELVRLAGEIDWTWIDKELADLFSQNGRPAVRVSDLPCMIDLVHASAKGSTNDNFQRSVGRTFTGL